TETKGYTGNLRFFASDLQSSVNTSEFKPRDAFVDNRQIKTEFTDGSFIIKNWRPTDTKIQWSSGADAIVLRESPNEQSNGNIYGYHIDGKRWINVSGYNKDINISSRNLSVKNHGDDSAVINIFGDSGNIAIKGNFSPIIDNSKSLGAPSFRWAQIYSASGTISTSDETLKTIYDITQAERDAALEIKGIICKFRFNESINFKGLELSRYHFGVGAQTVGDILRKHGLNPEQYAFWCYDEWPDVWDEEVITEEITDPDTGEKIYSQYKTGNMILVKKAGGRYGIRYDELAMFILMAM
ncbi:TPA: tail fiber domain-containing protein, partial [Escherichia coli]